MPWIEPSGRPAATVRGVRPLPLSCPVFSHPSGLWTPPCPQASGCPRPLTGPTADCGPSRALLLPVASPPCLSLQGSPCHPLHRGQRRAQGFTASFTTPRLGSAVSEPLSAARRWGSRPAPLPRPPGPLRHPAWLPELLLQPGVPSLPGPPQAGPVPGLGVRARSLLPAGLWVAGAGLHEAYLQFPESRLAGVLQGLVAVARLSSSGVSVPGLQPGMCPAGLPGTRGPGTLPPVLSLLQPPQLRSP